VCHRHMLLISIHRLNYHLHHMPHNDLNIHQQVNTKPLLGLLQRNNSVWLYSNHILW